MSTLIVSLPLAPLDAATLFDHVLSADGQTVLAHGCVALALLPNAHDEVVALVPGQALSWHALQLPTGSLPRSLGGERSSGRLRSILDGMLEDQLLDEPAHLHLALQPQASTTAPVWVAACDRAWLQAALNALAQAGHAVTRIVPEFTPQSLQDTLWVLGQPEQPLLAGGHPAAEAPEDTNPLPAAPLLVGLNTHSLLWVQGAGAAADAATQPAQLLAEPAVVALAERLFQRPAQVVAHAERLLQAAQSPWDMAQFELAHAARDRRWARLAQGLSQFLRAPQWRVARLALVVGVLVNLIGLNAYALREQSALNAKRQAVRAVLQDTFPKVPVVVDAPLQMVRELAALQRATGAAAGTDMESMLASFSAVAPMEYALTAIEYQANELRLKGAGGSGGALEPQLKALGLRATRQGDQWLISAGGQP